MRNLKRFVSLVLTVVMVMSLFVTPAAAKDASNSTGDTAYEGFHNGVITATAEDMTSNNRIADVRFLLEDITAGRYKTYPVQTTGEDGTATWRELSAGTYRITQVGQPETYTPNTKHEIVVLRNDGSASTQSRSFENVRKGRLIIYRVDPTDGRPVGGGTYEVANGQGQTVWSGTMPSTGSIEVPGIFPTGNYIIREKTPPTGFNQVLPAQNVYLTPGNEPTIITFTGAEYDTITVQLLNRTNYAPISGATFEILKAEGSTVICSGKTDGNGLWTSKGLDPGTYIIRQTAVIDGYQKILASGEVTITNDGEHKNHLVTLYNIPLGSITVMAYDTTTGQPLPGATVRLYDDKNTLIAETTSDTQGRAFFPNIPDGHYTTTVTPPPGYAMNDASAAVDVNGGSNSFVNVTGTELGSIQVRCLDARNGNPIEGATFKVYRMNGTYIGDMTTGPNGTAIMTNLESGSYTVEQTFVPAGYVKVTQTQIAKVVAGRIAEVTFVNRVKPFVVVETVVEGTRQPISGSTVTLVNNAGAEVARGYTDVTGAVTFEDLEPGRYTAKYAWAPDGYTVVVASQEVVVTTEVSGYACLTADKHSAIIIYKVDSQTQEPLYGATFEVRDQNGRPVSYITTDKSGVASTDILPPGQYTVREYFAPDHYVPNTEIRTVRVDNDDSSRETFTNTKKSQITVYAYDSLGNAMPNVPYIVYEAKTGQEVAHLLTNNAGFATTEELTPGNYIIVETTIPDNYTLVNPIQSHVVLLAGEASYVRYVHVLKSCIKIQTADAQTGEAIPGAEYLITCRDSSYTANLTANQYGEIITELLPEGIYEVKQIVAPEGYLLNTTTQTIQVLRDQVNLAKFFNDPMARIVIESVVAGTNYGLEECSYSIEDSEGVEVFHATTDATGILTTQALDPGKYTVKEIAVCDGYEIVQSSRTVEVGTYKSVSVKFEHIAMNSIIVKLTDINDPTKGLAGAHFMVRSMVGDYEIEIVTDQSGRAETPVLPAGTYVVHQLTTAEGYMLYENYQYANVNGNACAMVEFTNRKISGLVIEAMDEDTHSPIAGMEFEIYHENGKLVDHVTTDKTGTASVDGLTSDVYVIKNVNVVSGWTARTLSQKITITQGEPSTARFFYTAKSSLVITLTDEMTKEPLANGVFRVSKENGDIVQNDVSTDSDGRIVLPILPAGRYVVTQIKAPDGYEIIRTPVTVDVKDNQTAYANITNMRHTGLTIEVLDDENNHLSGAQFELRNSDGLLIGTYTAEASGIINITDLKAGTYTIKELKVPEGWTARTLTQTVTIVSNGNVDAKFYHSHKSTMIIDLKDAADKTPLAGGRFRITDEAGKVLFDNEITDEAGLITLPSLSAGNYIITQVAAPEGYTMAKTSITATVKDNETCYVHVVNDKNRGVKIEVFNADGSEYLTGATFEITDKDGKLVGTYTVDATGSVFVGDLKAGEYQIKETKGPDGWTIRTVSQTVTVPTTNNASVKFYHDHKSTLVVTLKDAKTSAVLAGGIFKVTSEDGRILFDNLATGADGQFTIPSMNAGRYVITQLSAPDGYTMAKTTVSVEVRDNETAYATVLNDKNTGLTVKSLTDDNEPLAGASFEVRNDKNVVVGNATVSNDGLAHFDNLPAGEYTVNETKVPDGWTAHTLTQKVTITANGDATIEFYHGNKSTLIVTLKDAKTNEVLPGGSFKVTSEDGAVLFDNLVTDNAGQFTIPSLEAGKYVITQLSAPAGYTMAKNPVNVTVKDNHTAYATILNDKNNGLTIQVLDDSNNRLAGAEFEVRNSQNVVVDTFVVDISGEYRVDNLTAGEYTVNEIKVPEGWTARTLTQKVTITTNGDAVLKFLHSHKSTLTINLKDADTKASLEGGEFKITKENGEVVADGLKTNSSGQIILDSLAAGRYIVMQVNAPAGYTKDNTPKTVEMKDNTDVEITVLNNKNMGLIIEVLDDENNYLSGGRFELVDANNTIVGTYDIDATGTRYIENLAAGKYTIREIQAPDGWTPRTVTQNIEIKNTVDLTVKFYHTHKSTLEITLKDALDKHVLAGGVFKLTKANGDVVENVLTTNEAGQIIISSIEAGEYILTQTTAPEGYVIKTVTYNITIKDDQTTYLEVLNYKNTSLVIETLDSENNYISGATFELYDSENVLVGTWIVDYTGKLSIDNLEPGEYTAKEIKAPEGWTPVTLTQTVTVTSNNDALLRFMHTKQATLTVNLKDANSGAFLAGATYRITLANGDFFGEYVTNTSGQFVVEMMPAGDYTVTMTVAPDGYVIDNTPYYVTIKDNKTVVLDLTLKAVPNFRLINTVKQTGAPIGGNKFKIMTYEGKLVGEYTTDDAGLINVELQPGTYTVYQTYVVEGCVKNETVFDVVIKAGENFVLEVKNEIASRLVIKFVDATSNAPIYNVKVEVKDENNNYVGQYTTDNTGSITLSSVFKAGKYKVSIISCPDGYIKDTVPKTVEIKTGETTEMTWKLTARMGAITIVTFAGEDSALMQVAKNSKLAGAVYQITDQTGSVVTTITGDYNGEAHSGPLPMGTYYVQMVTPPAGFQLNNGRATVNVINTSDNKRVEVFCKAAYYNMSVKVNGQQTVWAGNMAKYTFTNITNNSSSAMTNFYLRIKIPTDAMRAVSFNTGSFNYNTYYNIEYKTNTNDFRSLATGCSTTSNYSYDLSTQGLGLGIGEYVTDIRMVFTNVMSGFKATMAPSLYCAVLTGLPTGYMATVRAEVGGQVAGVVSAGSTSNPGNPEAGSWCAGAGQYTTYIYGYQNVLPTTLPKTGY